MSSSRIEVYLVESPSAGRSPSAQSYWKAKVKETTYLVWSLLGLTRTKPYDKSAAYPIARSLGIYPDQIPCLALFDKSEQDEKIIFPIHGDLTAFFRTAFSTILRASENSTSESSSEIHRYSRFGLSSRDEVAWELHEQAHMFERIRKTVTLIKSQENADRAEYNFYGQTVFINRPTGSVNLQDFQKS
jgi:hypothetical protein